MNSQRLFLLPLILFLTTFFHYVSEAEEPVSLPRMKSLRTYSSPPTTYTLLQIDEKPEIYIDFLALAVSLEKKYEYGVEWNRKKLEEYLGIPLEGRFMPSLHNPMTLDIQSFMIKDRDKIVAYLSQYGTVQILYRERWSQSIGEQISKEHSTVEPYLITFKDAKTGKASPAGAYAHSTVRLGITLNLTIQGLQISGDEPSAEITYEIDLRDSYRTADDLQALIHFISADSVNTPFSHTIIQSHLYVKEDVRKEYIFLLTPRNLK
ncbi:hypothetical protein JW926_14675 [Candidatus Sumerlaeota bacterium]|nr:hypothetical protein [Candidatus Sumerlaeota bacterium]